MLNRLRKATGQCDPASAEVSYRYSVVRYLEEARRKISHWAELIGAIWIKSAVAERIRSIDILAKGVYDQRTLLPFGEVEVVPG
jgi:hypothetical protein